MINSSVHESFMDGVGYPKLRRLNAPAHNAHGTIVLFTTAFSGTVVLSKFDFNGYRVGDFDSCWSEYDFTDFDGVVSLENA